MIKAKAILITILFLASGIVSAENKIIDLTYPYDNKTIYWPTEKGFSLQKVFYGNTSKGYFYSAYKFCAPEHGGTHIDAPRHFSKHGNTVEQIPLTQLVGNAVVIHVENRIKNNRDYAITVTDIKNFEKGNHPLTEQDIVLFYTGWGKYWGDKKAYLGTDKFGDTKNLHFPGLSKEAAQYLVDKKIKGIGIDTASMDPGNSTLFEVHRIILGANLFGIENVANLQQMPISGAQIVIAPMKIKAGSGAPTRVYAFM